MNPLLQNLNLWGEVWAAALWRASWQGAIAIAIVWAVARWFTFVSPRVVCWLWRLACLKLLVALVWTQPVPLRVLTAAPVAPVAPATASPALAASDAEPSAVEIVRQFNPPLPVVAERVRIGFCGPLFLLWTGGVMYVAVRIARQWRSARRLVTSATLQFNDSFNDVCREEAERLGARRRPRLLVSPHVESPLLTGVWRPAIVLPAGVEAFDAHELRLMLAHELAHHRRRDLLWNWLPTAVRALFFFHPLVWLMVRRWSEAQEAACDELLIQERVAQPAEYGRLLLKLAAREPAPTRCLLATAGVLGAFRNLERRVIAMSRVRPYSFRRLSLAAGAFALIAASSVVPWRLAPQAAVASAVADDKPASAKQSEAFPGKIYVWARLDLSSEVPFPHNYSGLIEVDPNTGAWRKVGPLGQMMRLSPDGSRVAYSEHKPHWTRDGIRGSTSELFLADLQNPQPVKLMEEASLRTWSPDGRRLLYHVHDGSEGWYGTSWSLELATKEKQKLPIPETEQVEDWTSNGDWLVTISGRDVTKEIGYQLYIMHPDGTGQRRITHGKGGNFYPRFSRDGKKVAYVNVVRGKDASSIEQSFWIADLDGSNARLVLTEPTHLANLGEFCWSPDGRWLARDVVENPSDPPNERRARLEVVALADGAARTLQLKDVTIFHSLGAPDWR